MSSKVRQAALKILLIQEEHTKKEIHDAIKLLKLEGGNLELIEFLIGSKKAEQTISSGGGQTKKGFSDQTSKAVMALREAEPEKYEVLFGFESLIRKGQLLNSLDEIKSLAIRISKDFPRVQSRKVAIPKLMEFLAKISIDELKPIIKSKMDELDSTNDSDYQRLADFLISGK